MNRRAFELDLFRFIAAISVVFYHYVARGPAGGLSAVQFPALLPVAKYGYLGVNLFFLISGFVILMSAEGGSVRSFAVSRAVRLYPAFWVCCAATFAASLVLPHMRAVTPRQFMIDLSLVSGFTDVPPVDGVVWSLLVELRFYLLVAGVLALGQLHRAETLLGLWLGGYLVGMVHSIKLVTMLLIPEYAPYFIAGAAFYLVSRRGLSAYRAFLIVACFALAAWQIVQAAAHQARALGVDTDPIVSTAIVAAFFATFLAFSLGRTRALASPRWFALGALTYPLYLLHQNIGYGLFNLGAGHASPYLLLAGIVALMLALSAAVVRFERLCAPSLRAWLVEAIGVPARPLAKPARTISTV